MKAERWKQVNDLFQSAVERAAEERAAFLDESCHGDEGLRREVGADPAVAPALHRDVPVEPLRPLLRIDVLEEGGAGILVKFVEQISFERPSQTISADILGEQVVRRGGRPVGLEPSPDYTPCVAPAEDEHRLRGRSGAVE